MCFEGSLTLLFHICPTGRVGPDCHRARHFGEQKFSQNWLISPLQYLNVAAPINIALSNVRPRAEAGEYKRPPFIQDLSLIFLLLAYNHNRKAFMTAHENENRDLLTTDQRSELDPPNRRHLDWEGGALSMDTLLQFHPHFRAVFVPRQKGQGLSTRSYSASKHIHLFPGQFFD